jgi:hypothetical protein
LLSPLLCACEHVIIIRRQVQRLLIQVFIHPLTRDTVPPLASEGLVHSLRRGCHSADDLHDAHGRAYQRQNNATDSPGKDAAEEAGDAALRECRSC